MKFFTWLKYLAIWRPIKFWWRRHVFKKELRRIHFQQAQLNVPEKKPDEACITFHYATQDKFTSLRDIKMQVTADTTSNDLIRQFQYFLIALGFPADNFTFSEEERENWL